MVLTREFKTTVKDRAARDPAFAEALLTEAIDLLLDGDVATGKLILRDYINATSGFGDLAARTGTPVKSLMRMLSAEGNPRANNLFAVVRALKDATGVQLSVTTHRQANDA